MKGEDRRRKNNNYPALQACGGEGSCLRACSTNCFSDKTPFFPFIRISILHVLKVNSKKKIFSFSGRMLSQLLTMITVDENNAGDD